MKEMRTIKHKCFSATDYAGWCGMYLLFIMCVVPCKMVAQPHQFEVNDPPYYFISGYAFGKDSLENVYIMWGDLRDVSDLSKEGPSIYLQKYDRELQPLGGNLKATGRSGRGGTYPGDILVFADGKYIIVYNVRFSDDNNRQMEIFIKGYYPDGILWFDEKRVDDGIGSVQRPRLVRLSDETFAVYWWDNREEGRRYHYAQIFLSTNIDKIGKNFRINPDGVESSSARIHFIEDDVMLAQYGGIVQYLDAQLKPVDVFVSVPGIITPLGPDSLFIAYTQNDATENYFQILDTDMTPRTSPIRVNDDDTVNPKWNPQIIPNPEGGYLLVWQDYRNGVPGRLRFSIADIYGQLYDANHNPIGANVKLNHESREMHQAQLNSLVLNSNALIFYWEGRGFSCDVIHTGGVHLSIDNSVLVGSLINFNNIIPGTVWGWETLINRCYDPTLPAALKWKPNYPNPFKNLTRLVFELNTDSPAAIDIEVYDYIGRVVRKFRVGTFLSGTHHFYHNLSGLSSGMYIARISSPQIPNTSDTIRLQLIK